MTEPKVIATIKGKDLPGDVKDKAIAEARLIAKKGIARFTDNVSIPAFAYWDDTPSGIKFWDEIRNAKEKRGK